MSTPTQESLIKICHLQTKPLQNGTCKLLYPRTLIPRDPQTFMMTTTMFPTLIHRTRPSTTTIPKGDLKNKMGRNRNLVELERTGGTSKIGLHAMQTDRPLNRQHDVSKACLHLTLPVVMHHQGPVP